MSMVEGAMNVMKILGCVVCLWALEVDRYSNRGPRKCKGRRGLKTGRDGGVGLKLQRVVDAVVRVLW